MPAEIRVRCAERTWRVTTEHGATRYAPTDDASAPPRTLGVGYTHPELDAALRTAASWAGVAVEVIASGDATAHEQWLARWAAVGVLTWLDPATGQARLRCHGVSASLGEVPVRLAALRRVEPTVVVQYVR